MVEKMSSDLGQNSRASNALMKRHESIQKWKISDTAREEPVRLPKQFTIQFTKGTCLLSAVASGDLEETTALLDGGVDINYTNIDGLTALHQACIDENEDMVNLLIERGADIEARDNEGWTPLHAAASAGNVDIAQILCDNDADLAAVNNEGEVPIDLAEEEEMEDFLTEEIEKGDLEMEEARNEEERIMLEDVSNWLNSKKIDERLDWQGATALHVAAAKGYNKVISLLLQIGNVDVNVQDNDGWTPVHAAVHWGSKTACELLTEAGGDFEIRNSNGQTPHDLAEKDFLKTVDSCRKKSKEIIKNHKNRRMDMADTDTLMLSAQKAIDLLKKQPPRPSTKGSRAQSKSGSTKIFNDTSVTNDLDSGTESASGESEHDSDIENKPTPKEVTSTAPKRLGSTSVETASKPSQSTPLRPTSVLNRDKKEETKPEAYSTGASSSSWFSSRYPRKEEEEAKKEEEPRSRFTQPSRGLSSISSSRTAPEPKFEEKKEDPVSKYTVLRQSNFKEEKVDDTRSKIRPRSKIEEDEFDSRTRKKEETETSMLAERPRRKTQEVVSSSDRSSDKPTERNTDRTSAADRYSSIRDRDNVSSVSSIGSARNWTSGSTSSDTGTGDTRETQRELDQTLKEVQEYKQKYERALKEKEELEKQLEQFKEDIDKMQELKNDNLRLKDENGALIRVISKLSRTPAS